jgi:hypothetical protein
VRPQHHLYQQTSLWHSRELENVKYAFDCSEVVSEATHQLALGQMDPSYLANLDQTRLNIRSLDRRLKDPDGIIFAEKDDTSVRVTDVDIGEWFSWSNL